jgi:Core histone H2A/H2B/H3/H4
VPSGNGVRFSVEALAALQETTEASLVFMFEMSNRLAVHAKRVTVMPKDVQLFREFVDALQPENHLSTKREIRDTLVEQQRKEGKVIQIATREERHFWVLGKR